MKSLKIILPKILNIPNLPLTYLLLLGFSLFFYFNLVQKVGEQQFVYLAKSFLEGNLYFTQVPQNFNDGSYYEGYYFWPQGPFPAILLMPFVALFGINFHQGSIQFFLSIFNCFLLYKIAKRITNNSSTALWLSFAYIFASSYMLIGLIPWSWWYAQVVATTTLLLTLNEYLNKRRWFLIGLFLGLGIATRISLFFGGTFFILSALSTKNTSKIRNLKLFIAPIFLTILLLFCYNFFRFHNFLEFGYIYHQPAVQILANNLKEYGAWNIHYFPTNLYYLFLSAPEAVFKEGTKVLTFPFLKPDIWGMSILITSPWILWIFKASYKHKEIPAAFLTTALTLTFLLGYFSTGVRQLGYRYSLDFMPFLFLILCYLFAKNLPILFKITVIIAFIINLYFFPLIFVQALN